MRRDGVIARARPAVRYAARTGIRATCDAVYIYRVLGRGTHRWRVDPDGRVLGRTFFRV